MWNEKCCDSDFCLGTVWRSSVSGHKPKSRLAQCQEGLGLCPGDFGMCPEGLISHHRLAAVLGTLPSPTWPNPSSGPIRTHHRQVPHHLTWSVYLILSISPSLYSQFCSLCLVYSNVAIRLRGCYIWNLLTSRLRPPKKMLAPLPRTSKNLIRRHMDKKQFEKQYQRKNKLHK